MLPRTLESALHAPAVGVVAALALTALAACGGGHAPNAIAKALPPAIGQGGAARGFNVLLVTFDTLRADALHCYGEERVRTPVVDGLAARGVRFTQAFSPAPVTLPSHASIMTGLEPPSHGVRNNATFHLAAEQVTLAERLAEEGYSTGAVVGAFVLGECYGLAQGFAHYDDHIDEHDGAVLEGHYLERTADHVTDGALRWLDDQGAAPFFLWVHYFDPHAPYDPPAAYAPVPTRSRDELAAWDPAETRARYLGEVAFADAELGRLLDALGEERLRRTLVVFTGDHGESLGEHNQFTHTLLVYDASMRVPLVFSCPTLFDKEYVVRDSIAGLVDIEPTVLALLGIEVRERFDGLDLFGARLDPRRALYGETLVTYFNHGWAPLHSLRRLDDKFILAPRPEYYDTKADPAELRNLYAQRRPEAAELARALSERLARATPAAQARERELPPDELRALAALGYARAPSTPRALGVLDPKDMLPTWAALTNAEMYSARGDFERALATMESVLRVSPNDAFAWETAYVVHLRRKAFVEAEECLQRVLELNPTCDAYVRLGQLHLQQGHLEQCDAALAIAARLDPAQGEVHLVRGDRYVLDERYDLARAEYLRALELDPVRTQAAARRGLDQLEPFLPAR